MKFKYLKVNTKFTIVGDSKQYTFTKIPKCKNSFGEEYNARREKDSLLFKIIDSTPVRDW